MPEGDTIWIIASHLHEALAGEVLTRSDFRVPRFATVDLSGRPVEEVVARGKHLLVRVGSDLTVHSHLGMDGFWRVLDAGRRPGGQPAWTIRVVLATASKQAVGYGLPVLEVIERAAEAEILRHLGPDLLGPDWNPEEAVRRLLAEPDRPIGEALLDQRNLAGIGNVYKSELCFLRGASPWTPVAAVGDLKPWVDLAHRLLEANRSSHHRVTASRRPGGAYWVYGRRDCQRCGGPVRRAMQGGPTERVTYWCPRCQPGPDVRSPVRDGSRPGSTAAPW